MYLTITLGDNKSDDDTENDIFIMCDTHAIVSAQRESLRSDVMMDMIAPQITSLTIVY